MNIEVGKFYKDASGQKVEVLAIRDGESHRGTVVVGLLRGMSAFGLRVVNDAFMSFTEKLTVAESNWTPWIDEPVIPWDSVPEWLEWWAVDKDGCQFYYESKPILHSFDWAGYNSLLIPKSLRIPYVGDWRESLRQRPGKEVAK